MKRIEFGRPAGPNDWAYVYQALDEIRLASYRVDPSDDALLAANNLSDLDSALAARTNLGVAIETIDFIFDDKTGAALATGIKGDLYCPFAFTINEVTLLADQSGSIVIDIWRDTYANYPPTVADSITASAKPTISAAVKSQDATLTGWTTSIPAGSTLRFNIDSAATITRCNLTLKVTRA